MMLLALRATNERMDQSNPVQNRRHRRSNVLMTANLEQAGQSFSVKLRNLSCEGALVQAEALPVEGSELLFVKGELRTPARVAWCNEGHAGLAFVKALDPVQVMRHVPAPKARVPSRYRRPGLGIELNEQERKFGEAWLYSRPLPPIGD